MLRWYSTGVLDTKLKMAIALCEKVESYLGKDVGAVAEEQR